MHTYTHTCLLLLILMLSHRQAIFDRRQAVFLWWMQKLGNLRHQITSRLNAHSQTDWAIEDQVKTWTQQPVPMMNEHSAHLTSLLIGFHIWLWRYTCLLLLILMLWHRQAIFELEGEELSSSTELQDHTTGMVFRVNSEMVILWNTTVFMVDCGLTFSWVHKKKK